MALGLEVGALMFGYSSEALLLSVTYIRADQEWMTDTIIKEHVSALAEDIKRPVGAADRASLRRR